MASLLIHNGTVLTPFDAIEDGAVLVRDGLVERVGREPELDGAHADERVDAGGRLICPGFVDLQVNGGGGALLSEDRSVDAIERMTRAHVRFGTTSLLATAVTAPEERMAEALAAVREAAARTPAGSRVPGAHIEGPFINPARRGAHAERFIQPPRRDVLERLIEASGGTLRLMTLAPELDGALGLIAAAREAGVAVSIGHSDATYEEALRALDAGASMGTHVFNAMRPIAQREPGIIGALLQDERAYAGLIADGVHVHAACLDLVARAKGADRTVLVTDAMPPVGAQGEAFEIYGGQVEVRDGACFLPDGTLAGSALSMDRAVRTMMESAGVPLLDAVRMATATPARALGMDGEIGVLAPGARADIVVCDDDVNVWKVFVDGETAFEAD